MTNGNNGGRFGAKRTYIDETFLRYIVIILEELLAPKSFTDSCCWLLGTDCLRWWCIFTFDELFWHIKPYPNRFTSSSYSFSYQQILFTLNVSFVIVIALFCLEKQPLKLYHDLLIWYLCLQHINILILSFS